MEIKHAIESIQHNFLLNTHEKMGLMELFHELAEYRKNPLLQMKPCWKYVRRNDINQQLDHVMQEVIEAIQELNWDRKEMECFDVLQGAVTLAEVLKQKYSSDLDRLIKNGIQKNTDREGGSYYE